MTETDDSKISKSKTSGIGRYFIIGILTVILSCLLLSFLQINKLKKAASSIQVGDSQANVVRILGSPKIEYYYGYPLFGQGAPTKHIACYGSSLDSIRITFEIIFQFILHRESKGEDNWPVIIEYDKNGFVLKVNK